MTSTTNPTKPLAVLLVDDDPDIRMVVRDALEYYHCADTVCEVGSGEEAIEFLYHRGPFADAPRPGLIYMDIQMPGMGGQAALELIRRDDNLADIPVVMMTGLDDDDQKRMAAANGANSYTVKPNDAIELADSVRAATDYWAGIHRRPEVETPHE